jgi:hypothetical protein
MSIFVALIYTPLLLQHTIYQPYDYTSTCPGMFPTPCFMFFSRFTSQSDNYYSMTLMGFAVAGTMISIQQWVAYDI